MVLTIAGLGCGGRTRTYTELAAAQPLRYRVVAGADPRPERVARVAELSRNPAFRRFADDQQLFAAGRLADVLIVGTQDAFHVGPCLRALELGYDVLLEKPIATTPGEVLQLERAAARLGRRVLVCHVLRYTRFYETVKELLAAGEIGDLVAVEADEGVGPWHQCHSFVRGHWAVTERATPMLIAKSCHDMDILSWLIDRPCLRVASHGSLTHFTAANAPVGAPARCTDGCPVEATCPYSALRYIDRERAWLSYVFDRSDGASPTEIKQWLATSPWGRCVYRCDNTAVDRQVVALEFAGGVVATFAMTAFDHGRNLVLRGTRGVLRGGDRLRRDTGDDLVLEPHGGKLRRIRVAPAKGGYDGHGGGDGGLIDALARELAKPDPATMRSGLTASVASHLIGFAAEQARISQTVVDLAEFRLACGG